MGAGNVPTFSWQPSAGSTQYRLELALDSAFSTVVLSDTVTGTQRALGVDEGLQGATLYYWRVTASGPGGVASSLVWSFTTEAGPGAFMLVSPDAGATGVPANTTFSWTDAPSETGYLLQI